MKYRSKIAKLAVCLFLSALSGSAAAGWTVAKISSIVVYEDGDVVYVFPEGGVKDAPACHGSNGDYLSFSLKRRYAREYYAGMLAAYTAGKTVRFRGLDACKDQSMSETLMYFELM
ncbi:hypothetical protein O0880_10705 [Janthinobacterium sp. SUN118]|nr:hypothetical protein [Janthinobacterium sp. SUN118]